MSDLRYFHLSPSACTRVKSWSYAFLFAFLSGWYGTAGAQNLEPLQQHMQHMLTNGGQWRTPNPEYDGDVNSPEFFGLVFELAPDEKHVIGHLSGVYEDGREAIYWTLYAMYNPVTQKVVTQQIGWDGSYLHGESNVQSGTRQVLDMIQYGADGQVKIVRHDSSFNDPQEHTSFVYERDQEGQWTLTGEWTWRLHKSLDES